MDEQVHSLPTITRHSNAVSFISQIFQQHSAGDFYIFAGSPLTKTTGGVSSKNVLPAISLLFPAQIPHRLYPLVHGLYSASYAAGEAEKTISRGIATRRTG